MNYPYNDFEYDTLSSISKNGEFKSTTVASTQRKSSGQFSQSGIKYKTQVCNYWKTGQYCPFGQMCSFAHGDIELRPKEYLPSNYKTKPCLNYSGSNFCLYGKRCQFIHGQTKKSKLGKRKILDMFGDDPQMLSLVSGHKFSERRIMAQQSEEFKNQEFEEWSMYYEKGIRKGSCEVLDLVSDGFKKPRLNSN